jgi:hypothetical protein
MLATPAQTPSAETPTIHNPAKAPRTQVVRLEELWRIGEDDDDVIFGAIGGMVVDRDGRVYVADMQARQISVFSPDGDFLRHLGREGEGPGEYREPRSLVLMPNGNVGVIHEQPPKIVCFRASDGEFVEDFHLAEDPAHPFQRLSRVVSRGNTFVVYASDIPETPGGISVTARLMRFDATGKFMGECDTLGFEFSFAKPVTRERYDLMWAVGPDERVYVNRGLEYGITVHGRACGVERVIAREYERLRRSSAEVDSLRAFYQRVGNIGDAKLEIFDHARDIAWFSVDDAGRLWTMSSRGRIHLPADSLGFFDIYDARGRLERTVDLKGERGERDWYFMDRDRFFVVHRATMSLVAHRLPEIGP